MRYYLSRESRMYLNKFFDILNQMEDKMLSAKPENSITIYFIECMIPHHQAAIYMCENLLNYTHYEPLQNIAKNIIRMQTEGIEQMKEIQRTTYGFMNSKEDVNNYESKYLEITKNMIYKMRNSYKFNNINLDFVSEMIPHHEGAISMCENLLKYRIDPRLVMVANSIIKEQSQGVNELKEIYNMLTRR